MATYIALLRGINVGPHKRVAMADLRALLTDLGHVDVRTVLQSGNAVFTSSQRSPTRIATQIAERVAVDLGVRSTVMVVTAAELDDVVARQPFDDPRADPTKHHVGFLSAKPGPPRVAAIDVAAFAPEELHVGERAVYLYYPNGLARANLTHDTLERLLGVDVTVRNWNTVTKLVAATRDVG